MPVCGYPHAKLYNLYLAVDGNFSSYKLLQTAEKYMARLLNDKAIDKAKDMALESTELAIRAQGGTSEDCTREGASRSWRQPGYKPNAHADR